MSRPGRNDPCYCGSGEKYKKCHMPLDRAADEEKRQRQEAGQWLRKDFMKFGRDERFAPAFAEALSLYWNNLYNTDNAEEMSQNEALRFFDWFVFDYHRPGEPRLIDLYRQERYDDLSSHQRPVLEAWLTAPPAAAYELEAYEGQILKIRDFMTGQSFEVYEPAGHGLVEPGDLLLGRLVPLGDRLEFSAVAAYLPRAEIADLREKLEQARTAYAAENPEDDNLGAFMRRKGYLIVHHALEQAEIAGRPPVAAANPNRADQLARKAARQIRRLQR
jgi:hypothetical protein